MLKRFLKNRLPHVAEALAGARRRIRWFLVWRRAGLPLTDELGARRTLTRARRFHALPNTPVNRDAFVYVGTVPEEGIAQLAILMHHGCRPEHKVLEIGCGALNAGYPIMQYLDPGNFCGIEPNRWLIEDSLAVPEVEETARQKQARFAYNEQFDPAALAETFDYVLSHSILSHAAHWQWPLFLTSVDACARQGTKILASLHFTDGNAYGGRTHDGTELDFDTWLYPQTSAFRRETIFGLARERGYDARVDLVAPMLITHTHPTSTHSWIVLEKL